MCPVQKRGGKNDSRPFQFSNLYISLHISDIGNMLFVQPSNALLSSINSGMVLTVHKYRQDLHISQFHDRAW